MLKRLFLFLLLPVFLLAQAPQVSVTTRASSGAPLTFVQADKNFTDLRDAVNNINAKVISAKDFGAKGDGATDDAAAINAGLAAINAAGGGRLYFSPGTYIIGATLDYPGDNISLEGAGPGHVILKAKAGVAFETMVTSNARTGLGLSNLTLDVNQANRFTALQAAGLRAVGVNWTSPIDGRIHNVVVKNAVGNGAIPGVGIGIGGLSGLRNIVSNCTALDCGLPGYAADGFYTSGTQTLIVNCVATNCEDTGFVLEGSNYSGIVGCTSYGCSAGGAITALGTSPATGNFINGLTINGWSASVTGGVQISALGSGNLVDTSVDGLVMTGGGTGPALNLRHPSTGRIIGITIRAKINGASTQGILVAGTDELTIASGTSVKGTTASCIQIQTGCTKIVVDGAQLNPTGPSTYGIACTDGTDITIKNSQINATAGQMTYGIYFFGTGTRCSALLNNINGHSVAAVGSDGTTVANVVAPMTTGSGFYFGKAQLTTLYDLSGVLKTDQALISGLTIKALGNIIEVGPTSASSGNGGSFRTRNDAGVSDWLFGHIGTAAHTPFLIKDIVANDEPISIATTSAGAITLGGTNARKVIATGPVEIQTAGKSLGIKEGTNAKMGVATLVAGTVTVSTTSVAANSRIYLSGQALNSSSAIGDLNVTARTAATNFTITAIVPGGVTTQTGDLRSVAWVILDPL